MTTSFQGPDEIVTSYEHIGNRMRSEFGLGGGLNGGFREVIQYEKFLLEFWLKISYAKKYK